MVKKILILSLVWVLLAGGLIFYLNNVFLPRQIKSILVDTIQGATDKKVTLKSLRFNLFKGLVLEELRIYDEKETLLRLKEASCMFLIFPIFKKKIVIPSIQLKSAELLLERRADSTFNFQDILERGIVKDGNEKFEFLISKIKVVDSRLVFRDQSLTLPFETSVENLDMVVRLSLPSSVKFDLKAEVPAKPLAKIKISGEYRIPEGKLTAKAYLQDLPPQEFLAYYLSSGLRFNKGLINGSADISLEDSNLDCQLSLRSKDIALTKEKISAELDLEASAGIKFNLKSSALDYSGSLKLKEGQVKIGELPEAFQDINGRLEFAPGQLKWEGLTFKWLGTAYRASGLISNFKSPGIMLELTSADISLQSNFAFINNTIKLSRLTGNYLNSGFSVRGDIDLSVANNPQAILLAELDVDLTDICEPLKKFKEPLEQIKPQGLIKVGAQIKGNITDFKSLAIKAEASGEEISLYGLRGQALTMNYNQADGVAEIPLLRLGLYDGTLDANASLNLNSKNLPYWVNARLEGVKLEKLKKDTQMKNEDISGSLAAQLKLSGFFDDQNKLSGAGKVLVTEGKLWQLNLFKGLGSLLFAKDFSNIVFNEASCDFSVQDKYVFTDNLKMLSNIADLEGNAKIGFDSSLDISLNVKVQDESAPLTGTFKDITTAIIGGAGRFGVIKITGTLKEPKYKFQTAVVDIIKGLKDAIFGK